MKRIAFDPCFINETGNSLMPGKIHTIRQNYERWKPYEGKEVALFTWEGVPYRSKHKVFCTKRIVSVQEIKLSFETIQGAKLPRFKIGRDKADYFFDIAENDGFEDAYSCRKWFVNYKPGKMAILHFTDFRY